MNTVNCYNYCESNYEHNHAGGYYPSRHSNSYNHSNQAYGRPKQYKNNRRQSSTQRFRFDQSNSYDSYDQSYSFYPQLVQCGPTDYYNPYDAQILQLTEITDGKDGETETDAVPSPSRKKRSKPRKTEDRPDADKSKLTPIDQVLSNSILTCPESIRLSGPKGSGIIPYCQNGSEILFLLQKEEKGGSRKNSGWNDFGGKRLMDSELPHNTAAREFSEETSCLFYLKEGGDHSYPNLYEELKDNESLIYDKQALKSLVELIPLASKFYEERIGTDQTDEVGQHTDEVDQTTLPSSPGVVCVNSNHAYSTYFLEVPYIPAEDIPRAEDIHIPYKNRYIRSCKWFTYHDLFKLHKSQVHKRLNLHKIVQAVGQIYKQIHKQRKTASIEA